MGAGNAVILKRSNFEKLGIRCIYTYKAGRMFMQKHPRTPIPPTLRNKIVGASTPAGACRLQRGKLKNSRGGYPDDYTYYF